MKYKVITTYKPGDWERYAHRMVISVLENWPEVDMTIYHEGQRPKYDHNAVSWVDIDKANNELKNFSPIKYSSFT